MLEDVLATEISPELLPPEGGKIAQKTEELVGPYELHDFYLYHAIRWGFPPRKVFFPGQAGRSRANMRTPSSKNGWSVFTAASSRSSSSVPACPTASKVGSVRPLAARRLADAFGRFGGRSGLEEAEAL